MFTEGDLILIHEITNSDWVNTPPHEAVSRDVTHKVRKIEIKGGLNVGNELQDKRVVHTIVQNAPTLPDDPMIRVVVAHRLHSVVLL